MRIALSMLPLVCLIALAGAQAAPAVPPGAAALGYTKAVIDEHPNTADIAPGRTGSFKWFDGPWYSGTAPTPEHYSMRDGVLVISLGGDLNSTARDSSPGTLPLLPGADGFYVEFAVQLSDQDPDHWPAVWMMPVEHSGKQLDHYEGDPAGFERWMELDVDEGGFGPGLTGTVHSWTGIWHGNPDYARIMNRNNVLQTPLDRSQKHIFGASFDPVKMQVTWWVDGVQQHTASGDCVPEIARKQNFYLIMGAQTHGAKKPYDMLVSSVRAFVPPTSKLPAVAGQ
jgi:hypothetical protein